MEHGRYPACALELSVGFSAIHCCLVRCVSVTQRASWTLVATAFVDQPTTGHLEGCSLGTTSAGPKECVARGGRRQELLGRHFFLKLRDFWRPAGVDGQLAVVDMQMGGSAHGSNWSVPADRDPRRPAGYGRDVTGETVSELCQQGQVDEAVEALGVLVQMDSRFPKTLFYTLLKKCRAQCHLVLGRRVHALTVRMGYESDLFLCNHVIRMYASHARLQEAKDVFTGVVEPDVFMWSSIISAHVNHGQAKQAIQLYHLMRSSGVKPDGHVFVAALQACARGRDLKTGQQVHADVLNSGTEPHLFVWNCLVDMYARCGSLDEAERVFDNLSQKDVVTWNVLISGYSQQRMGQQALRLYSAMQSEGLVSPDSVTFLCLTQACANVGAPALEKGKQVHGQIRERGHEANVFIANSLVNMYAKCGSMEDAQSVFDGLRQKDVVTWTSLIGGYSQKGLGQEALCLYSAMENDGIAVPDSVTFVSLLQACASVGTAALERGKQLHAQIGEEGLQVDVVLGCSLVNMYAKCGSLEDAQRVFDGLGQKNLVTWNAMIAGYAKCGSLDEAQRMFDKLAQKDVMTWNAMIAGYSQQGLGQEALRLYTAMQDEGIVAPDSVTFLCALQACASAGTPALEKGKEIHAQIRERGLQADLFIASSLVNMYAKCGSLEDAEGLFYGLGPKNVVTWSAMIAGYSQQGMGHEALHVYRAMQEEGIVAPDAVTFVSLLQACGDVAALHLGRQLHAQLEEQGLEANVLVAISLISMYGKSGSMVDAQQVFDALPDRDAVAWNALIAGYTRQGDSEVVFNSLNRMREDGIQPTGVTFLSLLTVCSHAGLVKQGQEYFDAMNEQYGIPPTVEHYACMVDLLGRAGRLHEALVVVRTMPLSPTAAVWHTLLGACQKWGNVEVGRHAFHEAVKLDEKHAAAYVTMSNIYTSAQMWEQAEQMQTRRVGIGAWKHPGQSWWTDMDGLVHSFSVGDAHGGL